MIRQKEGCGTSLTSGHRSKNKKKMCCSWTHKTATFNRDFAGAPMSLVHLSFIFFFLNCSSCEVEELELDCGDSSPS